MNNHKKNTVQEKVLNKIKEDNIQMKPKIRFVLQSVLYAGGVVLALGLVLYFASFIIFILRANGILLLPGFGLPGLGALFLSLPWFLILVVAILIILLELLGKHFSFVYRKPLIYSIFGIILLVTILGIAIAFTSVHEKALRFTQEHSVPIGGVLYERYGGGGRPFHNGNMGIVVDINKDGFVIETLKGETVVVSTTTKTRFPLKNKLKVGDRVMILGERKGSDIEALGIRKIDPTQDGMRPFNFRKK